MVRAPSIAFRMPLRRKFGRHTADPATQCPVQIVKFCPDRFLPFRKSGSETLSILYPRTRRSKLSIRFHPLSRLCLDAGAAGSPKLRPVEHPQPVGSRIQAIGFPERLQAPRRLPPAAGSRTPTIPCSPVGRTSWTGAGGRDATTSSSALNSAASICHASRSWCRPFLFRGWLMAKQKDLPGPIPRGSFCRAFET